MLKDSGTFMESLLCLKKIHRLTASAINSTPHVDLQDFSGNKRYAKYSTFNVGDSDTKYKLLVGGYTGDAGDNLKAHNGQKFTTKDQDNDRYKNGRMVIVLYSIKEDGGINVVIVPI